MIQFFRPPLWAKIINFDSYKRNSSKISRISALQPNFSWLSQVPTEVNNRVQSLPLNYHFALFRSGDFTLVYYQMGELEYIRLNLA